MVTEELKSRFSHHPPQEGQPQRYVAIRTKGLEFALLIDELCCDSREKEVAIAKLEAVVMWANASIARRG